MPFLPTQNRVVMKYPVLDGGLNTKFTDVSCPLNCMPDAESVLLDEFGAVRTCKGYSVVTNISSAPIDVIGTYYNTAAAESLLVVATNSNLYQQVSTSTFTIISGSTGIYTAPTAAIDVINVNNYNVFSDGQINPVKWDGASITRFGIPAPSTGSVAVSYTAGVLTGTYNYALTNVNSYGAESDYTTVKKVTAASNTVNLYSIADAPASYGVATRNVYRTTAAANTLYWLVTSISATQSYVVDNSPDSFLVVAAPLDKGMPPKAKFMTYYRGRVWCAGDPSAPYRLYFSNAGSPETFPSTNFIDVEKGDGQPISGIEAFGNSIVIHKNDGNSFGSVYLLYISDATTTTDTNNWYVFKSPAAFSSVAHRSQAFFKNLMFYLNTTGAYGFTGQDLARTSADSSAGRFQVDNLTYDIDTDVKSWDATQLKDSVCVQFDNKIWLAVPDSKNVFTNTKLYVYDFVRLNSDKMGVWSRVGYPALKDMQVNNGSLFAGDYSGNILQLHTGTNFNGSAIAPYWYTAACSGSQDADHRDNTKVFRMLYVTHDLPGAWSIRVDWYVDFSDVASGTAYIDCSGGNPIWGQFKWGSFTWGARESKRSRVLLSGAVGKIIQFKFSVSGVNENFKIKELQLEYNLRSKRGD